MLINLTPITAIPRYLYSRETSTKMAWQKLDGIPGLLEKGKVQEAITRLATIQLSQLESVNQRQQVLLELAICHQAQGNTKQAQKFYEQIQQLEQQYSDRIKITASGIISDLMALGKTEVQALLKICQDHFRPQLTKVSIW